MHVTAPNSNLPLAARGDSLSRVDALRRQLQGSQYHSLRQLHCDEAFAGIVRLRGQVPSFYLKQLAQTLATAVCGSGSVLDEIEVPPSDKLPR